MDFFTNDTVLIVLAVISGVLLLILIFLLYKREGLIKNREKQLLEEIEKQEGQKLEENFNEESKVLNDQKEVLKEETTPVVTKEETKESKKTPKEKPTKPKTPKESAPKEVSPKAKTPKEKVLKESNAPKEVAPKEKTLKESTAPKENQEKFSNEDYMVIFHPDGGWQVKKVSSTKALKKFNTKAEALDFGKEKALNNESKLIVYNLDGTYKVQ